MPVFRQVTSRIIIVIKFEKCLTLKVVLLHAGHGYAVRRDYTIGILIYKSRMKCYLEPCQSETEDKTAGPREFEFINYYNLYPQLGCFTTDWKLKIIYRRNSEILNYIRKF